MDVKKSVVEEITSHYGAEKQNDKACEELMELIAAIRSEEKDNIAEEMADVYIMLSQLKEIWDIADSYLEAIKNYKIERTLSHIRDDF